MAAVVIGENEVCVGIQVCPPRRQQWVSRCLVRLPGVEESQHGLRSGVIHSIQQRVVQRSAGGKALFGTLRLALFIGAKQIGGVVTKKICSNSGGALYVRRDARRACREHSFFAALYAFPAVDHIDQRTVCVDFQLIAYGECVCPAGSGELALMEQRLVIGGQCLQDHVTTSVFRQSSTPSVSCARKNCARMFCGSE